MGENNAPIACYRKRDWRLERNSSRIDWQRSSGPIRSLRPAAKRRAPAQAAPPWGRLSLFFSRRLHLMALSRLHHLLKKSRPLSRSAQQRKLTLEALENRTVLSFVPPVTVPVGV